MELIQYGEFSADVVRGIRNERTAIYDDADNYLYHEWNILVETHWHPELVAYTLPGGLFTAPVSTPGTLPGNTDLALLSRLLQPRKLLKITAGGSVILQSPSRVDNPAQNPGAPGVYYPCDARGDGPRIESVGTPHNIGGRHWIVTLHIIATVRDIAYGEMTNPNMVISNTWVLVEDIDVQRRSVRRIAGRAILRADAMRRGRINANSLRDLFLFRCPPHYQRQNVHVELSENGQILDWSFDDAMRGYDLGIGSEIVDIECFRTGSNKRGSPVKFLMDASRGMAHANASISGTVSGTILGTGGSVGGSVPIGMAFALASAAMENLPCSYLHARVDITGDRNANIGRLTATAIGICINMMGSDIGQLLAGTMEVTFRQDLADQVYTSVEMASTFTSDALIRTATRVIRGLSAVDFGGIGNIRELANDAQNTANGFDPALVATQAIFGRDSRRLIAVPPPVTTNAPAYVDPKRFTVVASRQGDAGFTDNPPFLQGAFGTVPQTTPATIPAPVRDGSPAAAAALTLAANPNTNGVGSIPAGIEHLIVQVILGQNQTPPLTATLNTDS